MIAVPEIVLERIAAAVGSVTCDNRGVVPEKTIEATGFATRTIVPDGTSLFDLFLAAGRGLPADGLADLGGVIAATFSAEDRFPSLAVRVASALGLPASTPAFDLQMACSAYPYAVYLAGRLAADTGKRVLVLNGDIQSRLTDASDPTTAPLFSDAATATLVRSEPTAPARSQFAFLSRASDALACSAGGPIRMDGFGVFAFVATEVTPFLKAFVAEAAAVDSRPIDFFAPHQANLYMVRQLARSLALEDRLLTSGERYANPGSCSVPLTLAQAQRSGRALIAGFGAGLSAAVATVRYGY